VGLKCEADHGHKTLICFITQRALLPTLWRAGALNGCFFELYRIPVQYIALQQNEVGGGGERSKMTFSRPTASRHSYARQATNTGSPHFWLIDDGITPTHRRTCFLDNRYSSPRLYVSITVNSDRISTSVSIMVSHKVALQEWEMGDRSRNRKPNERISKLVITYVLLHDIIIIGCW
jgi:hypothetical protein